jgi:hypothetical protein
VAFLRTFRVDEAAQFKEAESVPAEMSPVSDRQLSRAANAITRRIESR